MTPEQADIVYELRGARGIEGVYVVPSRAMENATVVVLDDWRPYVLAVATCALLRALPDRDRSHIAVTSAAHFHYVFADLAPLTLDHVNEAKAVERAASRAPVLVTPESLAPRMPDFEPVELLWFQGVDVVPFQPIPDPFRSLDPSMPILVRSSQRARERRHAWHAETVVAALERLSWAKPKWIACDEELAIGESGLLAALERDHPHLMERTMVIATEASADFLSRLMARMHPRVRVVTQNQN